MDPPHLRRDLGIDRDARIEGVERGRRRPHRVPLQRWGDISLVCTPMGRDQFYNAEQVQVLGAGQMLMPDAEVASISAAARAVLDAASCSTAAKQFATTIAGYGGATNAVAAPERLSAEN